MTRPGPSVISELSADLNPVGAFVAGPRPRLSWKVATSVQDWCQVAADIEVSRAGATETIQIETDESVFVDWPGEGIQPREAVSVRVRVTGSDGETSEWSDRLDLVGGFLADGEWQAAMIGVAGPPAAATPFITRSSFEIDGDVARATLYAVGLGVYQVAVNGSDVDDHILKPGWTSYEHRLTHETTDLTDLLVRGHNTITARVAAGWYAERLRMFGPPKPFYGEQPAVAAQIIVEYTDGRSVTVATDASWAATLDGPLSSSGIYNGDVFDARRAQTLRDALWSPVRVDPATIVPSTTTQPPVRAIETVPVAEVLTSPSGATILDFGQNLVGVLRITVDGPVGTAITLRHAEILADGELATRPLRLASATDTYVLDDSGKQTWQPEFTFHGFRYAEVTGWPGPFDPASVVAVVLHTDMRRTGWFESSDAVLNRFHENVVWGMRGNFLSIPTDCPQRNERLGWTGDINVFSSTASYLFDCRSMLESWLEDLALEQEANDGVVPFFIPSVEPAIGPTAGWGDAATLVPWVLYERFGDARVLEQQYPSMRSWVDTITELAGERYLWEGGFQFGDWLDPDAPPERPEKAKADPDIVASAYLWKSIDTVARTATLLGQTDDATRYAEVADRVRSAFLREYVTAAGRMVSDSPTPYALAIVFGIVDNPEQLELLGNRLAELVRSSGYLISTGFLGTPVLTDALTMTGHHDVAGRLMFQTKCPSWLFPVTMGATTIWERWDSLREDGSLNPGEMTSFNHYSLGSVADWLHRAVAGLAPAAPGYRRLTIEPRPLDQLDFARAEHETPYGRAAVEWRRDGSSLVVQVVVPPNTTADVLLPGWSHAVSVGSGSHDWVVDAPASTARHAEAPLGDGTSLAALIDDEKAFDAVLDAIAGVDAETARSFHRQTKWTPRANLGGTFFFLRGPARDAVDSVLARLNGERPSGHS